MTRAMFSVSGSRLWKSMYVTAFTVFFVVSMSFFSSAEREMKYAPDVDPVYPYFYDGTRRDKELVQNGLHLMTDEPAKFKRVFDFFEQHGLDINWISEDGFGSSYLTSATALKHWNIVPYLLSKGIDVDHQDSYGITTLIYASVCGHLPTVGKLIINGNADMTIKDEDGDDALNAAKKGQSGEYSLCPEGTYEDVIDYIQTAMSIENPDGVKQANSPEDTPPATPVRVEIPGFTFRCLTPDDQTIKPKFGDISKAYFMLPGQEQACVRKIDAAINDGCNHGQLEAFRGAAFFMNEEDAQKYAGCLPIFRLQAQECVAQYRLQRPRCEG